ncbi:MAG: TonB-dependent receptor [Robiginitomaculum sp.]|nr:TonB-dependent receptor [Robiginitomaculum sp.]
MIIKTSIKLLASVAITALMANAAFAQEEVVDEIIVISTGVAKSTTVFNSSASVTVLPADRIQDLAPRSVSELFRSLPGVKAEDTGGDANANIKVRGLPIASGGSRYFAIQEDGFAALLIGDAAFATADSFVRIDSTIGSVQSIRGGSSATQAANAAGGIVNLISKRPTENGGSIAGTIGLDYDSYRFDAEYGGIFGEGAYYHIGGFVRTGEGVRSVEGSQEEGYQIKASVGKEFERGNIAVYFKRLDDRVPTYLPLPGIIQSDGNIGTIGLDLGNGTNSLGITDFAAREGDTFSEDEEGFQAEVTSIAFVGDYDITDNLTIAAKGRYADISGNFYSPFPFSVAAGANPGEENIEFALFNTQIPDMSNLFGDVNIQGDFQVFSVKAGIDYANQKSEQRWNFNQARATLVGGELVTNGAPGSFTNPADGSFINGFRQGNPAFGFCCTRLYDFDIEQVAPYISANIDLDALSIEVSYRRSNNNVTGQFSEVSTVGPIDANGDGTIATNEQETQRVDLTALRQVNYDADYDAFSIGANYRVNDGLAIFANYSEGASLTSPDRSTGQLVAPAGSTVLTGVNDLFLNFVNAYEIGAKFRVGLGDFSIVYFDAQVSEGAQLEATTGLVLQNSFDTSGIEIEGDFYFDNGFGVRGNATFTRSRIAGPVGNANIGNTPRRQAPYIFNVNPYYEADAYDFGLNIFSTGRAPVGDDNRFDLPSFTTIGAYINYTVRENMTISLNANNLFDTVGFTEGEESNPSIGDFVRFRPINGRTVSATVRYKF